MWRDALQPASGRTAVARKMSVTGYEPITWPIDDEGFRARRLRPEPIVRRSATRCLSRRPRIRTEWTILQLWRYALSTKMRHPPTDALSAIGATFSQCRKGRYRLWRILKEGEGTLLWILHNSSTSPAKSSPILPIRSSLQDSASYLEVSSH